MEQQLRELIKKYDEMGKAQRPIMNKWRTHEAGSKPFYKALATEENCALFKTDLEALLNTTTKNSYKLQ